MPAVPSGKVLVTGANGFIAMWLLKTLLEDGYSVRGTVRSEAKAAPLREAFKAYGHKLELIVVEDIAKPGAFDKAVQDVDAIAHIASPVSLDAEEPADVIDPAVLGTTGILESALAHGQHVRRVVFTSSVLAIRDNATEPRVYSEDDWNESVVSRVQALGRAATQLDIYCASKVLAERAVWTFVDTHKDAHFDVTALIPPAVFGPPVVFPDAQKDLSLSMRMWIMKVLAADNMVEGNCWIDPRDLALAHVRAIRNDAAGGQRIVVTEGPVMWQDWVNAAHAIDTRLPIGDTTYDRATWTHPSRFSGTKAADLLGMTAYRAVEETTRDLVPVFESKGWMP